MNTLFAPLYEAEFGYGLSLHDAKIRAVEQIVVDGVSYMIWSLGLFQGPATAPRDERPYLYTLVLVDPSGVPGDLVGTEIYRFDAEVSNGRLSVQAVLLPEGNEISFECRRIVEVDLVTS